MAAKKFKDSDAQYVFVMEWWRWRKAYFVPEDNDKYWAEIVESGSALADRWKRTEVGEFAADMVMITINDLERRAKNGKG